MNIIIRMNYNGHYGPSKSLTILDHYGPSKSCESFPFPHIYVLVISATSNIDSLLLTHTVVKIKQFALDKYAVDLWRQT